MLKEAFSESLTRECQVADSGKCPLRAALQDMIFNRETKVKQIFKNQNNEKVNVYGIAPFLLCILHSMQRR